MGWGERDRSAEEAFFHSCYVSLPVFVCVAKCWTMSMKVCVSVYAVLFLPFFLSGHGKTPVANPRCLRWEPCRLRCFISISSRSCSLNARKKTCFALTPLPILAR